jgi:hypothetical protein
LGPVFGREVMGICRKGFQPEKIIVWLREAEVLVTRADDRATA